MLNRPTPGGGGDPASKSVATGIVSGKRWLPFILAGGIVGYLVLSPLIFMLWSSFKPTGLPFDPGFTFANFANVYTDADTLDLIWTTVKFVVGSTLLGLCIGVPLTWLVERTNMPGRRLFRALIILPMATPPVLMAIAWVMLLSPATGFFNLGLQAALGLDEAPFNIFSMRGMVFVQALSVTPSTFLILSPAFRNMDPSLEEAALSSGASTWMTIRRVVLPVLRPAILAAAAFLGIVGFVVFDVPGTLGMPARIFVLSSEIFAIAKGGTGLPDYGKISAIAVLFVAILIGLALVYQRLTVQSRRFVTITGKGYRSASFELGRWRWAAAAFVSFYFFLAVVAPLGVLVWTSVLPYWTGFSTDMLSELTLANHAEFLANRSALAAARNSVVVAAIAATFVALLSVVVSWIIVRSKSHGRRTLDVLAFMPMAMPGIMMGVALIYVYLTFSVVPIYGSIWILVVAYSTVYISFGTRVTNGVMHQIHSDLEEVAQVSGASWLRTFRKVTVPLMLPAVMAVWIWVVAHSMRELSTALMLQGRNNTVVSTLLWDYWSGGQQVTAAAVGVWLILALLLVVGGWAYVNRKAEL